MNTERLIELHRMLSEVPEEYFDMGIFGTRDFQNLECGSAACALGWAAVHPPFVEQGLRYIDEVPVYGDFRNYYAGGVFFGLTRQQCMDLFNPSRYDVEDEETIKPTDVMARIRDLIGYYPCHSCGELTHINKLDGKDDGTGNYTLLECADCYGPGYLEGP